MAIASAVPGGAIGCGSAQQAPVQAPKVRPMQRVQAQIPSDGMQVQGIMGTLTEREVQQAVAAQMDGFLGCFQQRLSKLEALSGRLELAFRVRRSGRVRWVYPRFSNLGDRAAERCMQQAAAALRFPKPRGGFEAEFSYPLELQLLEGVAAPATLDREAVSALVSEHGGALLEACRPAGKSYALHLTAYVRPDGQVVAAGASADELKASATLDCAAQAVQHWPLPGSEAGLGKVEFALR